MKKTTILAACGIATMVAGAAIADQPALVANPSGQSVKVLPSDRQMPAGVLYDNGAWDGINGYSAVLGGGFGLDRSLLDDFTVPAGGWDIGGAGCQYIWNNGLVGQGSDMLVTFMTDGGGCNPTTVVATTTSTSFTETDLGFQAFSREAEMMEVTFANVHLDPGHYWVKLEPVAGSDDNGFILTAAQNDCACWVDYADFGGLQPGINIFGLDSDITFTLNGASDCLTMTVNQLIGGSTGQWDVSGATPGAVVGVVFGLNAGSTVINGQLGFCATFGIAGVGQNSIVGSATADGAGNATVTKGIPAQATGLTVLTQAAEQGTCPDECVSNLDTQVVQ